MKPKWYIHRLRNLYAEGCSAEIKVVRGGNVYTGWVRAVCEPYTDGSLLAAWEVFRGRAYAFEWPKHGDIERIMDPQWLLLMVKTIFGEAVDIRNLGDVKWIATEDRTTGKGTGRHIACFILRAS